MTVLEEIEAELHKIPACTRTPELNPRENFFSLINKKLGKEAISL